MGWMLVNSSTFYESLPDKCCSKCGEKLEELADCYYTVCYACTETTFYPLSPVYLTLNYPSVKE
ncbi:protein YhfH [Paenibacillus periandrae]|uniref:protein YhfH n=1 Tax=Paenibacillus periandrae TaxID=1761741 RepID=UPI0030844F5D